MKKYVLFIVCLLFSIHSFAQELYHKVYFEIEETSQSNLGGLIEFDHLAKQDNGFVGEFTEEETNILLAKAKNVKILIRDVITFYRERAEKEMPTLKKTRSGTPANFHYGSMGGFMTLVQAQQNLDSMVLLYPNLITPKDSLGVTAQGRPIYLYKISDNPSLEEPEEHKNLFTALHHAREPQSLAQLVYFMWYLLENYNSSDSVIKHMVNDRALYFVPIVNPDGYAYNGSTNPSGGGMWRKNRRVNAGGSFGVDLNRNYAYKFAHDNSGSSPTASNDTYRGPSAFSENETKVIRDLCIAKKFKVVLNYHSYGNWFLYPWGYANLTSPDDAVFQVFASELTAINNYTTGNCFQTLGYVANGSSDDWMYGEQLTKPKMFAVTPEVGSASDGFWPAPSKIIPIAEENLQQNILASWMSGPYIKHNRNAPYIYFGSPLNLSYTFNNIGLDTCLVLKAWFTSNSPYFVNSDTTTLQNIMSQSGSTTSVQVNVSAPDNSVIQGRINILYNNFLYSDTSSFLYRSNVGFASTELGGIRISPNPFTDHIYIQSDEILENATLYIMDMSGRIVAERRLEGKNISSDLSFLAPGIYQAAILHRKEPIRWKIIKG